ncbi:transposase [Vibrio variabilis]|uniref:Transposase n=1 Tax=Vibrio variabilis TaxID=990271 RepID=A0ABQ0JLT5_9VIBR|nr:transposase [Vibrio variabilis]
MRAAIAPHSSMPLSPDAYEHLLPERKVVAQNRLALIMQVQPLLDSGLPISVAYQSVRASIMKGELGESVRHAVMSLSKGSFPSLSTLTKWIERYLDGGLAALAPQHTGRKSKAAGWQLRAQQLYLQTSEPSMNAVARKLREDEGFSCTDRQVSYYLKKLPGIEQHPQRLGRKLYNGSHALYKPRSTEGIEVGEIYMADGHTLDTYLAHPETGDLWRAELIVWMDVRSRFIVGWELTDFESAANTINSFVKTLIGHNHVPAVIYIDNGCGYKNRLVCDDTTGLYRRVGLDVVYAIQVMPKPKDRLSAGFAPWKRT